jgi:hypothetical protein
MSKIAGSLARLIAVGCAVLLIAGCGQNPAAPPASSSSSAPAAAPASGEKPTAAGTGGWMDGIPASIPPFTYGTYSTQSSKVEAGNQTMYSLYYEGVTKADVAAYLEKLKAAGLRVDLDPNPSEGGVSAAGELKKGEAKLVGLSISMQQGGHVDYTINVFKQTP